MPPDPLLSIPARDRSPGEAAEAAELLSLIGLATRDAHVMRLAFVDGWTHSAIAGLTDIPLGTVKTRIWRSLGIIRGLLSELDLTPNG